MYDSTTGYFSSTFQNNNNKYINDSNKVHLIARCKHLIEKATTDRFALKWRNIFGDAGKLIKFTWTHTHTHTHIPATNKTGCLFGCSSIWRAIHLPSKCANHDPFWLDPSPRCSSAGRTKGIRKYRCCSWTLLSILRAGIAGALPAIEKWQAVNARYHWLLIKAWNYWQSTIRISN